MCFSSKEGRINVVEEMWVIRSDSTPYSLACSKQCEFYSLILLTNNCDNCILNFLVEEQQQIRLLTNVVVAAVFLFLFFGGLFSFEYFFVLFLFFCLLFFFFSFSIVCLVG